MAAQFYVTDIMVASKTPGESVNIAVNRPKLSMNETGQLTSFVGTEGQRDVFFLKYTGMTPTRKSYKVFNFRDEAGRNAVCFADAISTDHGADINEYVGFCFIVQATVKRHQATSSDGKFPASTHINRIKILKTIGHPAEQEKEDIPF
jgi:hypothetical protein